MSPPLDPFRLRFYAGIGSRETPREMLVVMTQLAAELERRGYVLRSGGAEGADTAFEAGTSLKGRRIYLPWAKFNGRAGIVCGDVTSLRMIAQQHHPAWSQLTRGAQALHARNVAQVVGYYPEAQRSEFVVCWTRGGAGGGGTGQALRIARTYSVPIYDLATGVERGVELVLHHVTCVTKNV